MDLRRRLRSGRPALNLVHTGGAEELDRLEIVHTSTDLGRVLGLLLGTPPVPADDDDLVAMRELRTTISRMAYGLAVGTLPLRADVDVLNRAAAAPPLVRALHPEGGTRLVGPTAAPAWGGRGRPPPWPPGPATRSTCSAAATPTGSGCAPPRTAACCSSTPPG